MEWRVQLAEVCVAACVIAAIACGCSYRSTLSGAACDEEGDREEGRICKNGFWVSLDAGSGDATDGAAEECNGKDDDGDGVVDEGCSCDYDGATRGVCEEGGTIGDEGGCRAPDDWTEDEGRTGGCGDGLDNDCDGSVDEKCDCEPGTGQSCYSGSSETKGVGACESGTQTCTDAGDWGACGGDVTPQEETAATCPNAVDDDCDGATDEGCPCDVNGGDPGGTEGICADVTFDEDRNCREPEGYIEPTADESSVDACDGRDNDCDGATDEGCPCTYDPSSGEEAKADSDWSHSTGVCTGQIRNSDGSCGEPEAFEPRRDRESNCDGRDNDCDGLTDEGCDCSGAGEGSERDCYGGPEGTAGEGPCMKGTQTCTSTNGRTTWGATCDGEVPPEPETCPSGDNDVDKNCNGVPNDGCPCNYKEKSEGVCTGQIRDEEGRCIEPIAYTGDELEDNDDASHCDGTDNDCDGLVDEGCPCDFRGQSTGVCSDGTREEDGSCAKPEEYLSPGEMEAGKWCDGRDNDCDGEVDEDGCECVNGTEQDCYTGPSGTSGVGICAFGSQTCEQGEWGDCAGDEVPQSEGQNCDSNGKDDDCDGVTDEGCRCTYTGTSEGVCRGQTRDSQGNCQQPSNYGKPETSCDDGVDNDCDGRTDYEDEDCKKAPGSSCSSDRECRFLCRRYDTGNGTVQRCVHRIFATSRKWSGDLGGPSGADQKCSQFASAAGLDGNWKAILSDSGNDASTRITLNARLYNVDGTRIADGDSDLWDGDLRNEVAKAETGNDQKTDIWTGTDRSGAATGTQCSDWSSNRSSEAAHAGDSDRKNVNWVDGGERRCDKKAALYCVNGQ